jgi:hypothetical protein
VSVEYADGSRKSPFPAEWGRPPGDAYSEVRAAWVKARVQEELRSVPMKMLRKRQIEMLAHLRRALIEDRDEGTS